MSQANELLLTRAINERTRELLRINNMTRYKLIVKSGLSKSTVNAIIYDMNTTCRIKTVLRLAKGFRIGIKDFFDSEIFAFGAISVMYPSCDTSELVSKLNKRCSLLLISQIAYSLHSGLKEFFDSEIFAKNNIIIK